MAATWAWALVVLLCSIWFRTEIYMGKVVLAPTKAPVSNMPSMESKIIRFLAYPSWLLECFFVIGFVSVLVLGIKELNQRTAHFVPHLLWRMKSQAQCL